jgi:hypothetical protein
MISGYKDRDGFDNPKSPAPGSDSATRFRQNRERTQRRKSRVARHAALLPLSDAEKTQPCLGMPLGIEATLTDSGYSLPNMHGRRIAAFLLHRNDRANSDRRVFHVQRGHKCLSTDRSRRRLDRWNDHVRDWCYAQSSEHTVYRSDLPPKKVDRVKLLLAPSRSG